MSASISTGPDTAGPSVPVEPHGRLERFLQRTHPGWVAVGLFALAALVYFSSNPGRTDFYDHFVWQADAFLHGRTEIAYPVSEGPYRNDYFQDVLPTTPGRAQVPFPPLPAIILLPFVAVWGLDTNAAAVAAALGALNVALCWWVLLAVAPRRDAALLGALFYGFGTVAWYAAMLGTTWFLAHVVASTFLFVAIGLALRADGQRAVRRGFVAGLAFGTAGIARLTTIFGAPFFVFVGAGGSWPRRALSAGAGALIPVLLLLGYNLVTAGAVFHPAYDYLYEVEYRPRPELVHPDWSIEDPRYIPQNAGVMLAQLPRMPLLDDPACAAEGVGPGSALRPRVPATAAGSHRHEHPAHQPRLPVDGPHPAAGLAATRRGRSGTGGAFDRPDRPHALQPRLGPVRLPLQQ